MKKINLLILPVLLFALSAPAFAYSGDVSIADSALTFSTSNFLEGNTVRIYASTTNKSSQDLLGVVRFYANDVQVGADQAVSLFAGKTDGIFIDWTPTSYGSHKVAAKYYPWTPENDDPSNNWTVTYIDVARDTDHDGQPNSSDPDDDNDGVNDEEDEFPLNPHEQYDTDGDGQGNTSDLDDDNDGVPDDFDDLPLDPNESLDTDKDGIGNIADKDDDNDGLSDSEEENLKTDPLKADSDDDGVSDKDDAFPMNPEETLDTDNDGIGNNMDTDDDNDGMPDESDEFPLNKGPVVKIDEETLTVNLFEKVRFDASPSYDEDGSIVSFVWKVDNQVVKEGNQINHIFTKPGFHDVTLTVTDDQGESRTLELQANVLNINLYKQIFLLLFLILLALIIYFKYISQAENTSTNKE